jgi:hypothetical protein
MMIHWQSIIPQHVSGVFTPIIRRADCVSLPMAVCPGCSCCGSGESRCVHCEEDGACSLQPGQKIIGSDTQSALLMMGVKTPETC